MTVPSPQDQIDRVELAARRAMESPRASEWLRWYPRAATWCRTVAMSTGIPIDRVIGAVAATSPRQSWAAQQEFVPAGVRAWRDTGVFVYPTFRAMVSVAQSILDGTPLETVLMGPKVRAFASALLGDTSAVTLDSWALRVAWGIDVGNRPKLTPGRLDVATDAYRRAASVIGETPRDTQALVWCWARGSGE